MVEREGRLGERKRWERARTKEWKVILYSTSSRNRTCGCTSGRRWFSSFFFIFLVFSLILATRMHARFNNADSSMRSQRVVSVLTSTDVLPVSLRPRPFHSPCPLGRCASSIGHAQPSAHLWGRRVFLFFAGCEKRVSWHMRSISHGHPRLAVSRPKAHDFPLCAILEFFNFRPFFFFFHVFKRKSIAPARFPSNSEKLRRRGTFSQWRRVSARVHSRACILFNRTWISWLIFWNWSF